jgi:hypothetical protein
VPLRVAAFGDSSPISATARGDAALIDQIPISRAAARGAHDQVLLRVTGLGDSMLISVTIRANATLIDQTPFWRAALIKCF